MPTKVAIVTDSTSSIPKAVQEAHQIHVVPTLLLWSGKSLRDGVDIQPEAFYNRLAVDRESPTTTQPPPAAIGEVYDHLLEQGYDVLAIFLSKKLSGTYQSGIMAQAERDSTRITVLDSYSSGMGMGWVAIAAARAAAQGADLAACQAVAEKAIANVGVVGMLDTLKELHRSGRIGGARRFLGTALNVKPLLEVKDGEIQGLEQVRTRRKAIPRLIDILADRLGDRKPVHLAVMHANVPDQAEQLCAMVTERFAPIELITTDLSPTLGTVFGVGTLGLCYLAGVND